MTSNAANAPAAAPAEARIFGFTIQQKHMTAAFNFAVCLAVSPIFGLPKLTFVENFLVCDNMGQICIVAGDGGCRRVGVVHAITIPPFRYVRAQITSNHRGQWRSINVELIADAGGYRQIDRGVHGLLPPGR